MYSRLEANTCSISTSKDRSSKASFDLSNKELKSKLGYSVYDACGYIILDKESNVLGANTLFNPHIKSNMTKGGAANFLPQAEDEKGLKFAYIVFEGLLTDKNTGTQKPVQIIFMRRMFMMGVESQHPRMHAAAIYMYNIEDILKECFDITLKKDNDEIDYLFSGEGFFIKEDNGYVIRSMSDLEGKQLQGVKFDTRGTKTNKFKDANGPTLNSFISQLCMALHAHFDQNLRIITPEDRRRSLGESSNIYSLSSVTEQVGALNDAMTLEGTMSGGKDEDNGHTHSPSNMMKSDEIKEEERPGTPKRKHNELKGKVSQVQEGIYRSHSASSVTQHGIFKKEDTIGSKQKITKKDELLFGFGGADEPLEDSADKNILKKIKDDHPKLEQRVDPIKEGTSGGHSSEIGMFKQSTTPTSTAAEVTNIEPNSKF